MSPDTLDVFGLVGSRLDGKYEVESVVAEGGFGVVYRARHTSLQKPVAVKVLKVPAELEGTARRMFMDRFAQEARTIAALDHPAILRVMDFGASPMPQGEAAPWMVLEWLTGTTLDDEMEARRGQGGFSPAECIALLRPAFEAFEYAHEEGVVHRDIKPPNLMLVTSRKGERTVRVLDFGIAKAMTAEEGPSSGHTATRTHQRAFSLQYAAPEQLSGTRTGPWTDVYALALVLTEMLTDCPAYDGVEVSDIYIDALSPRRPTPAKRGFDVGVWEAVLARAVALKPAERFANAGEFLAALVASVPTSVRAPSVVSVAPVPKVDTREPDTLKDARTIRNTTLPGKRTRGRSATIAFAAAAPLVLLVGTASYLITSRQTRPTTAPSRAPTPGTVVVVTVLDAGLENPTPVPPVNTEAVAAVPQEAPATSPLGRPMRPAAARVVRPARPSESRPVPAEVAMFGSARQRAQPVVAPVPNANTARGVPTTAELNAALRAVSPRVNQCFAGSTARVRVLVSWGASGAPTDVRLGRPFVGTPVEGCVVSAIRMVARVFPFHQPGNERVTAMFEYNTAPSAPRFATDDERPPQR